MGIELVERRIHSVKDSPRKDDKHTSTCLWVHLIIQLAHQINLFFS